MDERLRFVARLLDGEAMSAVCREFGVSRKTGYKIFERYKDHGLEALSDRSRRPVRYAERRFRRLRPPMGFGAPISKASSSWATGATATR